MLVEPNKLNSEKFNLAAFLKKFWWLLMVGIFLLVWWGSYGLTSNKSFLSPLGQGGIFHDLFTERNEVVGFLPYWNIQESMIDFTVVDQLIYFGLTVGEDGRFVRVEGYSTEPGWGHLNNNDKLKSIFKAARKARKKVLFSVICFDPYIMDLVVTDEKIRDNLISEIITVVKDYDFDGVDIDFEYFPAYDSIDDFGSRYSQFLSELNTRLKKEKPKAILSTDIYPKAFIYDWPYDLKTTSQSVDQVVMMAYDFTQSNSDQAGPVAPIKGRNEYELSIVRALQASLDTVDKDKLLLGIPLYGYEWQTIDESHRTFAYPRSGVTASYDRVMKLIEEQDIKVNWDEVAYSPWLVYYQNGITKQIYFDNLKSISLKVELAKQLNLKGVAFWALGYEGQRPEFWNKLNKKL